MLYSFAQAALSLALPRVIQQCIVSNAAAQVEERLLHQGVCTCPRMLACFRLNNRHLLSEAEENVEWWGGDSLDEFTLVLYNCRLHTVGIPCNNFLEIIFLFYFCQSVQALVCTANATGSVSAIQVYDCRFK